MSVYFLREGGLIKIGFSNDVERRVAAIINGLRGKGEFLGCLPGGRDAEKHFHRMFAEDWEYGEWFRPSDRLVGMIAAVAVKEFPTDEERTPGDRLMLQEERYAEEAAYYIREFFSGLVANRETFERLSQSTSIPPVRLEAIYRGAVCPITAGEYVVLRMLHDAALAPDRSSAAAS